MITDNPDFWNKKGKQDNWQEYILPGRTPEQFYDEGKKQADELWKYFTKGKTILEYGCGVGRIINHMAMDSHLAIGIDISESYIEKAVLDFGSAKMQFYTPNLFAGIGDVADYIFSIMVFQHNSEARREKIIRNIIRLLKPGGKVFISFPRVESELYKETRFVHKFTMKEVIYYGSLFKHYTIETGNLVAYQNNISNNERNEYFLIAEK